MEPDVPGSEDLPLWKPEGPAAHAEAMVHFQRCLSGRVIKHQVRPSNPMLQGEDPLGVSQGPVLFLPTTLGPTQAVGQRGHCGEGRGGRRDVLIWRMVMGSPVVEYRSKLSFPQIRGE